MKPRDLLGAVRRNWIWPAILPEAAAVVALLFGLLQAPMYTSSAQLFVSTTEQSSTTDVYTGSQFSQQRVSSYTQLLQGETLASRVIDQLHLQEAPYVLQQRISAVAVPGTVLINVSVDDTSPQQAQRIAGALASTFSSYAQEIETPPGSSNSPVKLTITSGPSFDARPSSPRITQNVVIAILLGLAIGIVIAVIRGRLDTRIREEDIAAEVSDSPVIGMVLRNDELSRGHLLAADSKSTAREAMLQLATNLRFLDVDNPPRLLMVTSASPSEGKSTLALNLSAALADEGNRVVIVEADVRRPQITSYAGLVEGVGLTEALANSIEVDALLQQVQERTLWVLPAGAHAPNPTQLLGSEKMSDLLGHLREKFDYVIVDSPPVLPVADASTLAPKMDGVILSVRHGATRREHLERAVRTLHTVSSTTSGVVLNIVPERSRAAARYGQYGAYAYDS